MPFCQSPLPLLPLPGRLSTPRPFRQRTESWAIGRRMPVRFSASKTAEMQCVSKL